MVRFGAREGGPCKCSKNGIALVVVTTPRRSTSLVNMGPIWRLPQENGEENRHEPECQGHVLLWRNQDEERSWGTWHCGSCTTPARLPPETRNAKTRGSATIWPVTNELTYVTTTTMKNGVWCDRNEASPSTSKTCGAHSLPSFSSLLKFYFILCLAF